MIITLRLHAALRERAGGDRFPIDIAEGIDVRGLRGAIAKALPVLAPHLSSCRFALDDEFAPEGATVPAGATVDVIPPVSGG